MEVSVEQTSELGRKMTVTLPESAVQDVIAPRLKKIAKEARIDGFRRGKIPQSVISKMYGEKVRFDAAEDLIKSSYFEALKEQGINSIGYPEIKIIATAEGFGYTASFEVYPVVSLDGTDQLVVIQQVATVQESDVDDMIVKLKEQRKTWEVVERAAENKDLITIDFSGSVDGENFTDGKSENFQIEIGTEKMIPGFEDNLVGLKIGDTKTFTATFPDDYPNQKLTGKAAEFEIEVKQVEAPVLPEIDDEFIKAYGVENGTVETFRNDVKENMVRELSNKLKAHLRQSVFTALYEKVNLTLPNALIEEEIDALLNPYREMAKKNRMDFEMFKKQLPREPFEVEAKRRVALGLIIGEVIHQNDLKVDEDKVRKHVEDMAESYEKPEQVIEWYYKDENRLKDVRQMTMEEQVTEWLLEKATITTENVDFNTVMNA
jgi:trigger factor